MRWGAVVDPWAGVVKYAYNFPQCPHSDCLSEAVRLQFYVAPLAFLHCTIFITSLFYSIALSFSLFLNVISGRAHRYSMTTIELDVLYQGTQAP